MASGGAGGNKTYSFKVVLLGEGCVGKTSLVLRYCENKFNDKHITTLQVRVRQRQVLAICLMIFTGQSMVNVLFVTGMDTYFAGWLLVS